MSEKSAYAKAGVDIEAGDLAVELMKADIAKTKRAEVIGAVGGFAGLFDVSKLKNYRQPVLATSTDGVGTKIAIAQALDIYDTIGWDLIGMLVDDLVVVGAEPLFVTDYIACGKLNPEKIAAIVRGIAQACQACGAALLGGETAEHPGLMAPDDFDVAGATTGVVEADQMLGAHQVRQGDLLVAMGSSGLHSNGYSLVRRVLLEKAGLKLTDQIAELGKTLGEELLTPTRVYAKDVLALIQASEIHAMSHITGGGLANNLARVLPDDLTAVVDRGTWRPQPIFDLVQQVGKISLADIEQTLNQGVGMIAVVNRDDAEQAVSVLTKRGLSAWICGEITQKSSDQVVMQGKYAG